jgi:tetratricopeptide (TPR) repeat protein
LSGPVGKRVSTEPNVLTVKRTSRCICIVLSILSVYAAALAQGSSNTTLAVRTAPRVGDDVSPDLPSVEALYSSRHYEEAAASFARLPESAKASPAAASLLCGIDAALPDRRDPEPCVSAIHRTAPTPAPSLWKAYAAVASRDLDLAEAQARKSAQATKDSKAQEMLALVDYLREDYPLVQKHLAQAPTDAFTLTLLEGAALRSGNSDLFHALDQRLRTLKGAENGWQLYRDGLSAQQQLNWDVALDDFRRCDADPDFIDPICAVSIANVELKQGTRDAAQRDIDATLTRFSQNHSVLSEAVFIDLVTGNQPAVRSFHARLAAGPTPPSHASECLYFYGIDDPSQASPHCLAAVSADDKSNVAWSNAGYVALDLGQYDTAMSDFSQAESLYEAANATHTVTQELDLYWGLLLAGYMAGNKEEARNLFLEIQKENPDFSSVDKLQQLPLVRSRQTVTLMTRVAAELTSSGNLATLPPATNIQPQQ